MPITSNQMQALIGRQAMLRVEKMHIRVDVLDARVCWNRTDCLVEPLGGEGQQWVSCERLEECSDRLSVSATQQTAIAGPEERKAIQ